MARAATVITNVHSDSSRDIALQVRNRIERSRGTMIVFVRPDGRVRIFRDEMLEDDTGRGVVGKFARRHSVEDIQAQLEEFVANNQAYLVKK